MLSRRGVLEGVSQCDGISICAMAVLIEYRMQTELFVTRAVETNIPTNYGGEFKIIAYENMIDDLRHIALVKGKKQSHRPGLYYCNLCKGTFTVTVGSVFERSKVPLNKWLLATFLMTSSKKGMSAHQLHRMLGVTYKTA